MLIEIWSDIMCPFCYIGKHHFEKALNNLGLQPEIEVVYKSYQLNPEYHHVDGDSTYEFLSRSKGISIAQAKEMTSHVVSMGEQAGVHINFDTNIPANTFKAHELIHFAATKGLGSVMKERLFEAHFVEGQNVEQQAVLVKLAEEVGLPAAEAEKALTEDQYAYEVKQDIQEAQNLGIRGVPFFLFNRKYALSGAQPVEVFEEAIGKSFSEWKENKPSFDLLNKDTDSPSCGPEGCDI